MKNKESRVKMEEILHLFISLPTEDVCSLRDVNTNIVVRQLKSKVELRVGIPGDLIHLFFMNKELEDDRPLNEYNVKHGCILRVRLHKTWMGLFLACCKGDSYNVFDNGVQRMDAGLHSMHGYDVQQWNSLVVKRATYALFMATHRGYLSLMLELLNSSAVDVNGCTIFGRTCLHVAAFQGFVGCVSLLLSEGAVSCKVDIFGKTPLQLAYVNRHIYCQKRLYLHQTTSDHDEEKSQRKSEEVTKLSISQTKQRVKRHDVKNDVKHSNDPTQTLATQTKHPVFNFPRISYVPQDHPTSSSIPTAAPPSSHAFPAMKTMEHPKNHQPEYANDLPHSCPDLQSSISLTAQFTRSENLQQNIPNGIKGIENILRTAQDDIIGEYHNIAESISDVNVTTLKVTLPSDDVRRCDENEGKVEMKNGAGRQDIPETSPKTLDKRILGFVLQAEERSRNEKDTEELERESVDLDKQDISELSASGISAHRRLTSSLSYDEWLVKKKESFNKTPRPKSATIGRTRVGREINDEAFQKWLNVKKKYRRRRESEPLSSSSNNETNRPGSKVNFEMWLSQKRQQLGRGESFSRNFSRLYDTSEKPEQKPRASNRGGKTFAEWISEKRKGSFQQDGEPSELGNSENLKTRSHSGKSFRDWLRDKRKQNRMELASREASEIEKLQKKEFFEEQRQLNPRVKTFDEWFEEKRVQEFIEFVQSRNLPDEPTLLSCRTKFPEDAELVFDMWLTSKHMEELSMEEQRYEEMKGRWKKKEQERLQVQARNGILQKQNQIKRGK